MVVKAQASWRGRGGRRGDTLALVKRHTISIALLILAAAGVVHISSAGVLGPVVGPCRYKLRWKYHIKRVWCCIWVGLVLMMCEVHAGRLQLQSQGNEKKYICHSKGDCDYKGCSNRMCTCGQKDWDDTVSCSRCVCQMPPCKQPTYKETLEDCAEYYGNAQTCGVWDYACAKVKPVWTFQTKTGGATSTHSSSSSRTLPYTLPLPRFCVCVLCPCLRLCLCHF